MKNEQHISFEKQGFIVIKNVLSPELVSLALEEGNKLEQYYQEKKGNVADCSFEDTNNKLIRAIFDVRRHSKFFEVLPEASNITDIVLKFNDKFLEYKLIGSIFWYKRGQVGSEQPWHQDLAYKPDFSKLYNFGINFWVALDQATEENGCLKFVPKSHLNGIIKHESLKSDSGRDLSVIRIQEQFPNVKPLSVELEPGDAVMFNWLCAHSSGKNYTNKPRRAISYGYLFK